MKQGSREGNPPPLISSQAGKKAEFASGPYFGTTSSRLCSR